MHTLTCLLQHAQRQPHKAALVHDGVACSYAELVQRIASAQHHLRTQPLLTRGGDAAALAERVAVIVTTNLLDDWVLLLALRGLGLSTTTARTAAELQTLDLPGAVLVLCGAPSIDPTQPARWPSVHVPPEALAGASDDMALHTVSAPSAGHVLRTSGTTGQQKPVRRDVDTEQRCTESLVQGYGYSADSVVYTADFPLWTAGGYRWPLTAWAVGGTVVLQSSGDLLQPLRKQRCTHVMLTPDKLQGLLQLASAAAPQLDTALQVIVTGGSLSRALLADTQRLLSPQVYSALSSSEASLLACTPLRNDDDLRWHRLLPTRVVQVVDELDRPLPPGVQGPLRVRIEDGLAGYYRDEAATREHFRDGWFYPGDLGLLGHDGRLALCGRETDVVNVLGNKVSTGPFEQGMRDRLGVTAVCLIDLPGSGYEDELHLVIETTQPIAAQHIADAVRAEIGSSPVSMRAHFFNRLPRNTMGKVQRPLLRDQLVQAMRQRRG